MALNIAKLVHRQVARAKRLVSSALVDVQHEPFASRSKAGVPTYRRAITRQALVVLRQRTLRSQTGQEIVSVGPVTFLEDVRISNEDRLTLPGGQTGVVAFVETVQSPVGVAGGGYVTAVWLGEFGR